MDVYFWIITLCIFFPSIQTLSCNSREAKCKIIRTLSMKAADCYNKDMTTFSQCLPRDVEVVDLSHNRIRKLSSEDLKRYSNLKMLYLNDNLIAVIDKETFEEKDYLQTLDLSLNAITKLPPVLFQLPSLQSLYLGQNLNMNIVDIVEKSKPITSPLFHLDISYTMSEEPNELPDFGLFTTLEKYNISGNKIISMTTKHFAGLCSLKILDTTNVSLEYYEDNPCNCWTINQWLRSRKVNFKQFLCTVQETECLDDVPSEDLALYKECINQVQENIQKSKMKTILLIVIPISALVLIAIVIYFFVRRRQMQRKKGRQDPAQQFMLNNAVPMKK